MERKRTKLWRRKQGFRMFKKRMIYYASFGPGYTDKNGLPKAPLHWFELAKEPWTRCYRSTGTPCSCFICRREKYNRQDYKKVTNRIIRDSER